MTKRLLPKARNFKKAHTLYILSRLSDNSNFENLQRLNKPKSFQKIAKMAVLGQSENKLFQHALSSKHKTRNNIKIKILKIPNIFKHSNLSHLNLFRISSFVLRV